MNRLQLIAGVAAVSAAGMMAITPAFAQTAEEEQEKLLQRLDTQQKTLEVLGKEFERLKQAQVKAKAAAPTPKQLIKNSTDKAELTIKGQINRAVMIVDDGAQSEAFHVDNDFSSTRFSLLVEAKPKKDLKVGAHIELEVQSNASNEVTIDQSSTGSTSVSERIIEVYFDSKDYGSLTLGLGKAASDSTSQSDLSGTGVIALSKIHMLAGDVAFREDSVAAAAGPTIDAVYSDMDGLGREDRIRYDSPKFHGFQISASHTDGGEFDLAFRHSGKFDGIKTKAAIAYANSSSVDDRKQINGSVSVLFPNGLSTTFAAGSWDPDAQTAAEDNPLFYWVKLGYQMNLLPNFGKTALSIDYGEANDLDSQGDKFESIGGAIVQRFDDWSMEVFLSGRNYSLVQPAQDYQDIFVFVSGARIKF